MCRAEVKVADLVALPEDDELPQDEEEDAEQPFEIGAPDETALS